MYEVEVKVRTDHDPVRDRLAALGAEHVRTITQTDTYFDAPHRDFAETDEALRIRRVSPHDGTEDADFEPNTELAYKGPLVDETSKTREEIEAAVANGDDVKAILDAVGFTPAATVRKVRERYRTAEFTVTLDTVEDLGDFVEVETTVEREAAVESAREAVFDLLERLDLDPDAGIRTSYLGLLLAQKDSSE